MVARVVWSPNSLECIDKIAAYIEVDSVFYARVFVAKVFNIADRLAIFPQSGRIVPEYQNKLIREILFGNYRVVYRIDLAIVNVLAVSNSAQTLVVPGLN